MTLFRVYAIVGCIINMCYVDSVNDTLGHPDPGSKKKQEKFPNKIKQNHKNIIYNFQK